MLLLPPLNTGGQQGHKALISHFVKEHGLTIQAPAGGFPVAIEGGFVCPHPMNQL